MKKRVAVLGVLQETNTFVPGRTEWGHFERGILLFGEEMVTQYEAGNHEISGFLTGLRKEGIEPVPILFAFAHPGPMVALEALERLWAAIINGLNQAGEVDGILVAVGGGAVCEAHEDMDGWLLAQLRQAVGGHIPLIATLDPHCHISENMLGAADALLPYRTNPHLDQKERGAKAARLIAGALQGRITLEQRFCRLPFIINIEKQATSAPPLCDLFRRCLEEEGEPGILDASLVLGFPYGDVPEMGSGVLVLSDGDGAGAEAAALRLGAFLWRHRDALQGELLSPEAAVTKATRLPSPALLLDMGDNIGGGAQGDATWLAHLLLNEESVRSFVCLHDPQAVVECMKAGVGNAVSLSVGGWSDPALQGAPLQMDAVVEKLPPTRFREEKPRHGGWLEFDLGECCLVSHRSGHLKVMITSRPVAPFSAGLLTVAGLRIGDFDVITAKGVHGPIGAFGAECPTVIWANTPGITTADLHRLGYQKRPRPMEPFEPIASLDLKACIERPSQDPVFRRPTKAGISL